jgi:O-antigen ligase
MRKWSAALLGAILFASGMTSWVPERWPASILEVGAFVLALAWIVRFAVTGDRLRLHPLLAGPALLLVWGALQLLLRWTVSVGDSQRALLSWAANLAVLFAGLQTFDRSTIRDRFLEGLLWFGAALGALAIVQSLGGHGRVFGLFPVREPDYVMGPFVYHNHYAAFIEAVLPLAVAGALTAAAKRGWYALASAVMIASVVVSASRSGFVLVAAEAMMVAALIAAKDRRAWRATVAPAALVVAISAIMIGLAGPEALARRFQVNDSLDRLQMLRSSLEMARDHAFTGVGLGNWPVVFPSYAHYDDGRFANQAHNDWAQIAAECGVVGLCAFAAMFVWAVRESVRRVWCIGIVFVFLQAFVDYPFHNPQVAAIVFALMSAAAAGNRFVD